MSCTVGDRESRGGRRKGFIRVELDRISSGWADVSKIDTA
jgi:hypothetical protein